MPVHHVEPFHGGPAHYSFASTLAEQGDGQHLPEGDFITNLPTAPYSSTAPTILIRPPSA
jgi:hypothetical protein